MQSRQTKNHYLISAWALAVYGIVALLGITVMYAMGVFFGNFFSGSAALSVLLATLLIINVLPLLCGYYLLRENRLVHLLTLPVSVVILAAFPLGTMAGGIYLYQRYNDNESNIVGDIH